MLIRFYNLGKIKETTLDLRPLTVIIGPNNSNKTYIAYSLYGLWQAERESLSGPEAAGTLARSIIVEESGSISIKVDDDLLQSIQSDIDGVTSSFREEMPSFFQDSSNKMFADTSFQIKVDLTEVLKMLERQSSHTRQYGTNLGFRSIFEDDAIKVRPYLPQKPNDKSINIRALIAANWFIREALFPKPFLLPAERNAFVITYKMLANRRYKALRESLRQAFGSRASAQRQLDLLREGGEVRYPEPIEDFLDFLTDVETANSVNTRSPFAKLAIMIEGSIQNTNRTRYRPTALGGKEIITQVEKGLDIDLYNASSSIKQLAPLLLYLRYRAQENDLLIIDEPEMNLHPESQAKLLEVLAMLVNHGVNVLLTTHSPYLMAHLNNLAQADGTSQAVRNRQAKSLYLKHPDSLLRMDQVSAYEMKDNQLQSLKDPDYGIRWDTLSDVAADLQQRYFAIYEEGHAKERARNGRKTTAQKNGQKERQSAGGQDGPDQP